MENQCAYLLTLQRVFGHPLTSGIVQAHTNSHLVLIILLTISSCFYKNMRYLQVSTNYPTVYFPPLAPGRPICLTGDEQREGLACRSGLSEPERKADLLRAVVGKAGDGVPLEDAGESHVVQVHTASSSAGLVRCSAMGDASRQRSHTSSTRHRCSPQPGHGGSGPSTAAKEPRAQPRQRMCRM